jgi:hypothetical protein
MPENAEALAHYYHLRAQGVDPTSARLHVRMRFGIIINGDLPVADDVTERAEDPIPPREDMELGGDFPNTIYGTSTGPQYGVPVNNGRPDCEWCEGSHDYCDGSECEK